MGVIGVFKRGPTSDDIILEWINETQWLQRNGGAVINLNLVFRNDGKAQQFSNFQIVVPYRIERLNDTSDDWLKKPNVTYYSRTSGDYFRIKSEDQRLIEDAKGEIFANKFRFIAEIRSLPKERFVRHRYYTLITIQLTYPIGPNQRHMIQMEYYAPRTAFRRATRRRLLGSNWYFVNRYYSLYDVWDAESKSSGLDTKGASLLPVEFFENWIALPGFARSAQFSPEPVLLSMATVRHPGYFGSILGIRAQIVARFRLRGEPGPHNWYCKEIFGEYESQPLPIWVEHTAFWLGLIGVILAVVSLALQIWVP